MVPTLAGVILLIFFLFKLFGGDPAEVLAGQVASAEQIDAIRRELGLDQPWPVLVMREGEVVERGSPEEIFRAPRHDYTKEGLLAAIPRGLESRIAPLAA